MDDIDHVLQPLETSLTVYRGIDSSSENEIQLNNLSFISTSYDKNVARGFTGQH
jgi:hypothetical protein